MMSSGMNGQNFAFNGYLPIEQKKRKQAIIKFEKKAIKDNQAQLFIETPYRSDSLHKELLKVLLSNTLLCVGCDLSLQNEYIKTLTISQWKNERVDLNKRPCIFIIEGSF